MPIKSLITHFLNDHFGGLATGLLRAVHVHPVHPDAPITVTFAMELLVFLVLIAYFVVVRATLSIEKPAAAQHLAEMTNEFISEQSESLLGHGSQRSPIYLT